MQKVLFHASPCGTIEEFEPRKEATPTVEQGQSPARVYATDNPAYASGHGFSWATREGFDLGFIYDEGGKELVKLAVPKEFAARLMQPVYIYQLPGDTFHPLEHVEPKGHNFASTERVKPLSKESFPDIRSAIEFYGGVVEIKA